MNRDNLPQGNGLPGESPAQHSLLAKFNFWQLGTIPDEAKADPERFLRYHLMVQFANIGLLTGFLFTAVYLATGFYLCALLVFAVMLWLGTTWPLLRHPRATTILGNYFALMITLSLIVATLLQSTLYYTTIAWFTAPALICLLIAGRRSAMVWCAISVALIGVMIVLNHLHLPVSIFPRERQEHPLMLFAGYAGLPVFVLALALSLERARQAAFTQFQTTVVKLAASHADLLRLSEEKNEFVGIAAHDLKSPLCLIMNMAEFMKLDQSHGPAIDANADAIVHSAERMKKIIETMLNINVLEQRSRTAAWDRLELNGVLDRLVPSWQASARSKNIALVFQPAPTPLVVAGDLEALERIAENLVANAIKYSPPDTQVRLTTAVDDARAVFAVEDRGPGIPPDKYAHLFQKYSRLKAQPVEGESSQGLGLFIVKRFVAAMDGTVECDPRVTSGARFVVRIPLATGLPVPLEKLPADR
ncbi:MAG TPA: HAMP domain-containing sensor histidine kinase [Opitutaceae bacterium]|nr:HAMP domain-containing sensor histidine kinase [Opitutaceae bacterium]